MGEENNIDKLFRSAMEPMKVDPPDNSRIAIEAELEKKRSIVYQKRIKHYRMLAAVLALLLISFTGFYLLEPFNRNEVAVNPSEVNSGTIDKKSEIKADDEKNSSSTATAGKEENNSDEPDATDLKLPLAEENNEIINSAGKRGYKEEIEPINPLTVAQLVSENNLNEQNEIINSIYKTDHIITKANSADVFIDNEKYSLPNKINIITQANSLNLFDNNFVTTGIPVSLFVFYSPNYSYCLLKDNTPDVVDDVQMYKDQETPGFSHSTGFALRYNLSGRWGVSAGITYSTVVKSISLLKVYAAGTDDNMYYAYHTSSGMIEIPHPENIAIHTGDSLNFNSDGEKILKFVNVPLMARYVISKEKINWFFNGGLSVNFLVQDQVRISIAGSEETVKNKTQGLKKMSYGFVIGAGVEYELFNNLNLVFEPVYKGIFTSITEDAAVKNYPYSVGINLGASINF